MKRNSQKIKKEILAELKKGELTLAQLERRINTGFRTIKQNCEELEEFGLIKKTKIEKHPKNGKPFYKIKLTFK